MSLEVRIEDNEDIVRDDLGRIMSRIPEVEKEFAEELMEIAVEEIRASAKKKFNNFSGNMRKQISMNSVEETTSSEGTKFTLRMSGETPRKADYLEWNERAEKGHYVEVSRDNKPIKDWVDRYYDASEDPNYLFVQPTPFVKPVIQQIARRTRQKANSGDNAIANLEQEV